MTNHRCEIRVALIGYVSVGKSTVLNALLGDKFSEVSMRRTTAGVNMFRVINKKQRPNKRARISKNDSSPFPSTTLSMDMPSDVGSEDHPATVSDSDFSARSAKSTHAEIRRDNKDFRSTPTVQEKVFIVEVDEPICEMRKDTDLVIVDVPGINEADSSSKYKDYVAKNWNTFDLIVLVMDAVQGVNTEEQVQLLKFVNENNKKKGIHTIIVGNKLDDPDDAEKIELVEEARGKVAEIFGESCSKTSLENALKDAKNGKAPPSTKYQSFFIPVSALHAFIYRKAVHLTMEQFREFDKSVIDKIGHEEVGRKWKRLTEKEKFETISSAVSDPLQFKERLGATNFDNFLELLAYLLGGDKTQLELLKRQLDFALEHLSYKTSIADQIHSIYNRSKAIGRDTGDLPSHFWRTYNRLKNRSLTHLQQYVDPLSLSQPMVELSDYNKVARQLKWESESDEIRKAMDYLVRRQMKIVLKKQEDWNFCVWFQSTYKKTSKPPPNPNRCHDPAAPGRGVYEFVKPVDETWDTLSPNDWMIILKSLLRPACLPDFVETFGDEKDALEELLLFYNVRFNSRFTETIQQCNHKELIELIRESKMFEVLKGSKASSQYKAIVKLKIPTSLSDPKHWGHLAWKYCKIRTSMMAEF